MRFPLVPALAVAASVAAPPGASADIFKSVVDAVTSVVEEVEEAAEDVGDGVGTVTREAGEGIGGAAKSVGEGLGSIGHDIGAIIGQGAQRVGAGSPDGSAAPGAGGAAASRDERASRIFAGPGQYPPEAFAAYAVVAFHTRATSRDRDRYMMVCEAYVSAIPHAGELELPPDQQLATVWPVTDDAVADEIGARRDAAACALAVDEYGLVTSHDAIESAEASGLDLSDRKGPFLFAWAPPEVIGAEDGPILYMDLTTVETIAEAKRAFRLWVRDIEEDPSTWLDEGGWDVSRLRGVIRDWANEMGADILVLFTG